jgi:hypothetical protein
MSIKTDVDVKALKITVADLEKRISELEKAALPQLELGGAQKSAPTRKGSRSWKNENSVL